MLTDTELVGRVCNGDDEAFCELVKRHKRTVYNTALAIVRSSADAEDVTQTAWLRAYCNMGRFRGSARVSTWLIAIVRHEAIDHQRTARRRFQREFRYRPDEAFQPEWISELPSAEDLVLLSERRAHVARSMKALPAPLRRVLELWYSGRYSYREMAQRSGVPTGTLKSRVWEARRRLRLELPTEECRHRPN